MVVVDFTNKLLIVICVYNKKNNIQILFIETKI